MEKVQVLNRKIYDSGTVGNTILDTENFPPINTDNIKTNITNTDSIHQEENESQISLLEVKEKCKLNEFENSDKTILEDVIDKLYSSTSLKVGAATITKSKILSKLELITKDNLVFLLDIIKQAGNIKNITNYLIICLYNNLGNINIPRKNVSLNKHHGRDEKIVNEIIKPKDELIQELHQDNVYWKSNYQSTQI